MKTLFALLTVAVLTGCNSSNSKKPYLTDAKADEVVAVLTGNYSNSKKPHFTDAEIKEMSKWSGDKITGYFIGRYGKDDGVRMMYEYMQHPHMQGEINKKWYQW